MSTYGLGFRPIKEGLNRNKEKVHFAYLSYRSSFIFIPPPQNRVYNILQLSKSVQIKSLGDLEQRFYSK